MKRRDCLLVWLTDDDDEDDELASDYDDAMELMIPNWTFNEIHPTHHQSIVVEFVGHQLMHATIRRRMSNIHQPSRDRSLKLQRWQGHQVKLERNYHTAGPNYSIIASFFRLEPQPHPHEYLEMNGMVIL